jgi:hypothetical protein
VSLCTLIVMTPNGDSARAAVTPARGYVPRASGVSYIGSLSQSGYVTLGRNAGRDRSVGLMP